MDREVLLSRLQKDLRSIGLPVDDLDIKLATRYSKTYYGLYYPKTDKYDAFIRLYPYRIVNSDFMYPYTELLDTAIHEMCHHMQYTDPNFTRVKGVVHNADFWEMYHKYINRAETAGLMKGDD